MDRDRARAIYEEIVRRRADPALIELAGHGLLRVRDDLELLVDRAGVISR